MQLVDRELPGGKRNFVGYGRHAPEVPWPNDARVALNFVINYEEGSEYNMPAGDGQNEGGLGELVWAFGNQHRDLALESVYEYGSRVGIWRLQRLFDRYDFKVTFFACAVALERNPDVGAWIRERGHEPCSHGWRWEEMWRLTREQERDHMKWAIDSIARTCGQRPLGWYCRYDPSVHTRELVVEEGGFEYDSDAYNDDLPYYVEVSGKRHLVVPYTLTYNDGKFAAAPTYGGPGDFVENCKRGLDYLWEEGETHPRMMSVGLHPRLIGQASRTHALREFIDYAQAKGKVWITTRLEIARWWQAHHAKSKP